MGDISNASQEDAMSSAAETPTATVSNPTPIPTPAVRSSSPCPTSDSPPVLVVLAAVEEACANGTTNLCVRSSSATSNITASNNSAESDNLDSLSKSSDSCNLVAAADGASTASLVKNKSQKNLAERAKKTPWYNAIYPSYKSRTEDFKKLFREISNTGGDDERLIVDYSCAIQKDILVHGRLYVTQNYLCFHANIIVWETRLSIRWKEVTSITKEKTARVIPNAILVCTENEKHFLTSFTSRDKTYLMLFRVWQNALMDKPINPQELWQWVHTCYGDQLGLTSDDEDYIDPYDDKTAEGGVGSISKQSSEDLPNKEQLSDEPGVMVAIPKETPPGKPPGKKNAVQSQLSTPSELLPTDMSDSTESEPEEEFVMPVVECNSLHSGRQLVHTILPINVDILFELLFSKSKFLTEFHNSRKTTDMIHGEWTLNKDGLKERVVSLTIAINQSIGPRSAQVTETQLMRECSKPGALYSIDVNAVQGGIPYADSFYVTQHYCLSRTKDDHTVMSVHAQVHYKKNIFGFVRGFIEKNTWVGLEDFYNALLRSLQSEYCIPPARSKSRRSRKQNQPQPVKVLLEEPIARSTPLPNPTSLSRRTTSHHNKPSTASHTFFSWFILILLIILLAINVALYLKLANLEGENRSLLKGATSAAADVDRKILKNPPQSHADWLALLHEQEAFHAQEMIKWQHVLQTVTDLLKKVSSICENIPRNVSVSGGSKDEL